MAENGKSITRELQGQVRQIELVTRRLVNEVMAGSYHSVYKGRGMEFDEVREYQPGDDVRAIDWNVTARTGLPHIKTFVEERELTVLLMVDLSGSMAFGSGEALKTVVAAKLCALLAFSAIRNNDRVGLLLFADDVMRYIPPKKGKNHVLRVVREVLTEHAQAGGTNLPAATDHVMRLLKRGSVVFVVSDFMSGGLRRPLGVLNRSHDLVALKVRDPREMTMPPVGVVPFEDPETGEILWVDTMNKSFRRNFEAEAARRHEDTLQMFRELKIDFAEIDTDKPYLDPIVRLFHKRAMRY